MLFLISDIIIRENTMPYYTRRQRLKIALGGFILFIGFIVLILIVFVMARTIDTENTLQLGLLINFLVVIGVLDILAGILLLHSR